jgi:hypothetical protein
MEALRAARPGPATTSQLAPVIDWSKQSSALHAPVQPDGPRVSGWARDFVNALGEGDDERNPNSKLRVTLPAAAKAAAALSKLRK